MRMLMVSGTPYEVFMAQGVSLLSAIIKQEGFEFEYFDICNYDFNLKNADKLGESQLEYKKISNDDRLPVYRKKPESEMLTDFLNIVKNFNPTIIGLSAMSGDACFGKDLLMQAKHKINIPIIVGGVYPTVDPENVIQEPWVDMINIGPGEESVIELLKSYHPQSGFSKDIKNIWFKENGTIVKNEQRPPLKDVDWLPYPDWTIFEDYHFYRPFVGKYYRYGTVEIARGCPLKCGFCINSTMPRLYGGKSIYLCKSVDRAIDEMVFLKDKYKLEFIRFGDELFLAKPIKYLRELSKQYNKYVGLPFIISTTASSINEEKVKLLKEMNCVNIGLGVETGNEKLRKNVLNKNIPDSHYAKAYELINSAGIRSAAQIMFGLPHEKIDDYKKAIKLVKDWGVDTAHIAIFYPFKGTTMRDKAISEGLLDQRLIEEFENNRYITTKDIPSLLNFSDHQKKHMMHYKKFFTAYKELPSWAWPFIDACIDEENDSFAKKLAELLRTVVYQKRFKN